MASEAHEPRIQSVARALGMIDLLVDSGRDMSLAEIATGASLAKSTAHGLLSTLKDFGYIEQSPFTGRYRLGIRFFEVGSLVVGSMDVRTMAQPYIDRLVGEMAETVHLAILDRGEVLYIDKRESYQSLAIASRLGARLPAHCTGVGKALLAYLAEAELKRIVRQRGLARFTSNTITTYDGLQKELALVRERGYAADNEEIMDNLRCIAAPVFNHEGRAVAAISVSGPVVRLSGDKFTRAVDHVTKTASDISAALGKKPRMARGAQ